MYLYVLNQDLMQSNIAEAIRQQLIANGENVKSAKLLKEEAIDSTATFVILALFYEDYFPFMDVSFIVYNTGEWFSPVDWQSWQPETLTEIGEKEWRLGVTNHRAIIIDGLPRLI